MLSIVIPALNEEEHLQKLLESIKRQDFTAYEIIVADAGSEDKTAEIAKKHGCAVVQGGLPAKGRNEGAKAAKGGLLLFLDADVTLPPHFLKNSLEEFAKRNLGVASYCLAPAKKLHRLLLNISYNVYIRLFERILPHGAMGIMVKKEIFEKVGGFDPAIRLAEDMHFVRRAAQFGKFGIFRSTKLSISVRRFEKDGWLSTALKSGLCELHTIFLGPVRSDIFKYRFNHYAKKQKP